MRQKEIVKAEKSNMNYPKKRGLLLIFAGICIVLIALALLLYNQWEQRQAMESSQIILQKMEQVRQLSTAEIQMDQTQENGEMAEVEIDGESYIGTLRIPSLKLELPVISQWSYPKLKTAPCRYAGTIDQENLVLLGHNYKTHFGKLDRLESGAQIEFEDVNQTVHNYLVLSVETIDPANVEQVTSGDCDLVLFTCTYDGRYRTMVKCDAVNPV